MQQATWLLQTELIGSTERTVVVSLELISDDPRRQGGTNR